MTAMQADIRATNDFAIANNWPLVLRALGRLPNAPCTQVHIANNWPLVLRALGLTPLGWLWLRLRLLAYAACGNPPINGTTPCSESKQVGQSTPRPMPTGAGGGQGGLGGK